MPAKDNGGSAREKSTREGKEKTAEVRQKSRQDKGGGNALSGLRKIDFAVDPAAFHQLRMGARRVDRPRVEHVNFVAVHRRRDALGDYDLRFAFQTLREPQIGRGHV